MNEEKECATCKYQVKPLDDEKCDGCSLALANCNWEPKDEAEFADEKGEAL